MKIIKQTKNLVMHESDTYKQIEFGKYDSVYIKNHKNNSDLSRTDCVSFTATGGTEAKVFLAEIFGAANDIDEEGYPRWVVKMVKD